MGRHLKSKRLGNLIKVNEQSLRSLSPEFLRSATCRFAPSHHVFRIAICDSSPCVSLCRRLGNNPDHMRHAYLPRNVCQSMFAPFSASFPTPQAPIADVFDKINNGRPNEAMGFIGFSQKLNQHLPKAPNCRVSFIDLPVIGIACRIAARVKGADHRRGFGDGNERDLIFHPASQFFPADVCSRAQHPSTGGGEVI